jgi:hypothetical protein
MNDLRPELPERLEHLADRVGIKLKPKLKPKKKSSLNYYSDRPLPEQTPQKTSCFVYVMRCEQFVKIGIAADPKQRVKMLQVGNPFPIKLLYQMWSMNARRDERLLHRALKPHRERGEWFRVTDALETLLKTFSIRAKSLKTQDSNHVGW